MTKDAKDVWLAVLNRIKGYTEDEVTRTLAQILREVIIDLDGDPRIDLILAIYEGRLYAATNPR